MNKCKKSLEPASVRVVPEIVPDQDKAQYLGESDNAVGENNSGLVSWDNGAAASRESDIGLVYYDDRTRMRRIVRMGSRV